LAISLGKSPITEMDSRFFPVNSCSGTLTTVSKLADRDSVGIERNLTMRLSPTKLAVTQRRQEVSSMYLRGEPQWKIAHHFGVHPGQISRDLRAIQKQWQEAALFDLDQVKARQLAKLDEVEHKAWLAWDRSCKDAEIMEVTGTNHGGKSKPEKVKKTTKGQAGDSRFLAIIQECCKRRCQILGLDAPKQQEHQGAGGGPIRLNLSDEELTERVRYRLAFDDAKRNGTVPPPRPTFRDGKLYPPRPTTGP
jgi:hypothetical protein